MKNRVRLIQIGCGYWGINLLRNAAANPRAEVVAVCDNDPDILQKVATQYPDIARFSSFDEMLANSSADGVIIATPSGTHYKYALAALEASKNVLVEKPMASSLSEATELVRASEKVKRILMVGHTFLYNNVVQRVREHIKGGDLGDIYYAYSQRLNLGRFRRDSDVLWTLAPHDVSIMNYLFDARPHRVSCRGLTCIGRKGDMAEVCFAHLEYPDGRSAHLHMSWLDPQKKRQIIIVGSDKMLIYDDMDTDRHIQIFDKQHEQEYRSAFDNFTDFTAKLRAGDLVIPNIKLFEPLYVEIDHFITAIQSSKPPLTDGRHGLEIIAILESLTYSMKNSGSFVTVKYES